MSIFSSPLTRKSSFSKRKIKLCHPERKRRIFVTKVLRRQRVFVASLLRMTNRDAYILKIDFRAHEKIKHGNTECLYFRLLIYL